MPSPPRRAASPSAAPRKPRGNYTTSKPIVRGPLAGLPRRPSPNRSQYLTPRQIRELVNVEAFAEDQGLEFAVHVTIHWQCDPAFDPAQWGKRTSWFLDKLGKWLDRQPMPTAFAWAHEIGPQYGYHTHLLLHIPRAKHDVVAAYQAVRAKLLKWIIATENFATDKLDHRGKPWLPVMITPDKPYNYGMRNAKMRAGAFVYLLEGIDPNDFVYRSSGAEPRAAAMGIRPKANAKPIDVQRYGASRTLGPKARREAGWRELTSVEDFHARLKPV